MLSITLSPNIDNGTCFSFLFACIICVVLDNAKIIFRWKNHDCLVNWTLDTGLCYDRKHFFVPIQLPILDHFRVQHTKMHRLPFRNSTAFAYFFDCYSHFTCASWSYSRGHLFFANMLLVRFNCCLVKYLHNWRTATCMWKCMWERCDSETNIPKVFSQRQSKLWLVIFSQSLFPFLPFAVSLRISTLGISLHRQRILIQIHLMNQSKCKSVAYKCNGTKTVNSERYRVWLLLVSSVHQ